MSISAADDGSGGGSGEGGESGSGGIGEETRPKWSCKCCTYKNWPAASKCALCTVKRSPTFIVPPQDISSPPLIYDMMSRAPSSLSPIKAASLHTDIILTDPAVTASSPPPSSQQMMIPVSSQIVSPGCASDSSFITSSSTYGATKKWICIKCTYLNFARSLKCTVCGTGKTAGGDRHRKTFDQLDHAIVSSSSSGPSHAVVGTAQNPLPSSNTNEGYTSAHEKTSPLRITTADIYSAATQRYSNGGVMLANRSQDRGAVRSPSSPRSPEVAKLLNNNRNRATQVAAASESPHSPPSLLSNHSNTGVPAASSSPTGCLNLRKWSCQACTYENWPRANSCVLCKLPRIKHSHSNVGFNNSMLSNSPLSQSSISSQQLLNYKRKTSRGDREWDSSVIEGAVGARVVSSVSPTLSGGSTEGAAAADMPPLGVGKSLTYTLRQIQDDVPVSDWVWLLAVAGLAEGGHKGLQAVQQYVSTGGELDRKLSSIEVTLLGHANLFDVGYTLLMLALRFKREDAAAFLLTSSDMNEGQVRPSRRRLPPHVCSDRAMEIQRLLSCALRPRKGPDSFFCYFVMDCPTFALPAETDALVPEVRKQLMDDIIDREVQKELDIEDSVINWSQKLADRFGGRLYPLWNRKAGDCLLDSVLQATYGVFDTENTLRKALSDSLREGDKMFHARWKAHETRQAELYNFTLEENQWEQAWDCVLNLAGEPGSALEQIHIFVLAHILRRPIIVYGVKYAKGFRGDAVDLARFQGVYLPLLWDASFCSKSPIVLGYTTSHFSALVPIEMSDPNVEAGAGRSPSYSHDEHQIIYLPLIDNESNFLPLYFMSEYEMGRQVAILKERLVAHTVEGVLCCNMVLETPPTLVAQMTDRWMDRYRRLSRHRSATAQLRAGSAVVPPPRVVESVIPTETEEADGDEDEEEEEEEEEEEREDITSTPITLGSDSETDDE